MKACGNCGTRLSGGICPNCEEESLILRDQYPEDPWELSQDFRAKLADQEATIRARLSRRSRDEEADRE